MGIQLTSILFVREAMLVSRCYLTNSTLRESTTPIAALAIEVNQATRALARMASDASTIDRKSTRLNSSH